MESETENESQESESETLSKDIILNITCPTTFSGNYIKCSILDSFPKFGKYSIFFNDYLIGEAHISGDLLPNDPQLNFDVNELRENRTIYYELIGKLFDINYIDYLVLDNKNITSYNIYSNNSISFYKDLLKGLYYIISQYIEKK